MVCMFFSSLFSSFIFVLTLFIYYLTQERMKEFICVRCAIPTPNVYQTKINTKPQTLCKIRELFEYIFWVSRCIEAHNKRLKTIVGVVIILCFPLFHSFCMCLYVVFFLLSFLQFTLRFILLVGFSLVLRSMLDDGGMPSSAYSGFIVWFQ